MCPAILLACAGIVAGMAHRDPTFSPTVIRYDELRSGAASRTLAAALSETGLVALSNLPSYEPLRQSVLAASHACGAAPDAAQSHTFQDGATRRTLATFTIPGRGGAQQISPHASSEACQDLEERAAPFRDLVAEATDAFAAQLTALFGSSRTPDVEAAKI